MFKNIKLSDGGTITEEHIKASVLSAIEDKVRRRFNEQMAQNKAELDILQQSQRELTLGKNKLDSILTSLSKEKVNHKHYHFIFQIYLYIFVIC